jgi:hypothetical protein
MAENPIVETGPGVFRGIPLMGAGGCAHAFVPSFYSSGGGSLEVHFYDINGEWRNEVTYALPTTPAAAVGAYALGGTFLQDRGKVQGPGAPGVLGAEGYKAYARGASVQLGRGGLRLDANGNYANVNSCNPFAPFDETLGVGDALEWCCFARSDGWRIVPVELTEDPMQNVFYNILNTENAVMQYLQRLVGDVPDPTQPIGQQISN